MCFFAFQVRLFHLQTVVPPQEISKTEDLLYLKTTSITSHSSHTHTHTHIIHARRTVVVDLLLLLFFFCYYIYLKKNGEIIGNVPLGRANSVWIGLLGWGKFVLVHVVVFAFEREEYESGCW